MTPEDVLREAEEIDRQPHKEGMSGRLAWLFVGLFLAAIVVLYTFPYQWIIVHEEPKRIISVGDALAHGIERNLAEPKHILNHETIKSLVNPADQKIKLTANRIVTASCKEGLLCYSKALYYFIRDNYRYIPDPVGIEYIEDPREFLVAGGGDCESGAIALAALQEAIGIDAQIVLVPKHAYVRIKLAEAPGTIKKDGWIYLDWTCKDCAFGELPAESWKKQAAYIEVP